MIFEDTGGWYAAELEDDANHDRASAFLKTVGSNAYGVPVTTNHVLDETLTLLRIRRGLDAAVEFLAKLRGSSSVKIIWVDRGIFQRAFGLFEGSKGRSWSFTECTSFVMMKDLQIAEAFSFDPHFTEAGFALRP